MPTYLFENHFPATIPILIAKTPTNTTIETPANIMALIDAIAIIVFLLPEDFFIQTHHE